MQTTKATKSTKGGPRRALSAREFYRSLHAAAAARLARVAGHRKGRVRIRKRNDVHTQFASSHAALPRPPQAAVERYANRDAPKSALGAILRGLRVLRGFVPATHTGRRL